MALQGNIDSFSVVDVLRLLGSSAKSGRLVVDGDRGSGSLWLAEGLVVAGTTTRAGAPVVAAPPSDVLFDLLRFSEGAFVFDAGVEPSEAARTEATGVATEIEPMIAEAEEALVEWDDIVAVVPSLRTSISLTLDLADESVVIDRRTWSGIVAVAAGIAATGDRTTVGAVADLVGLSELPAMRLVRDLVVGGLVDAGSEVAEEHRFAPAPEHASFEDASFEDASFEGAVFAPFEPAPFEAPAFDAPAFEPAGLDDVAFDPPVATVAPETAPPSDAPPAYEPADVDLPAPHGAPAYVPPPIGNIGAPTTVQHTAPNDSTESFDAFAPFDPFGTAEPSTPSAATADVAVPGAEDDVVEADPVSEQEQAAQQAEFARQLAMLSPRAAEAVASAEAGPSTEDEERARVARFLGSV